MVSVDSPVPNWIYRWLKISCFICIFDGSFCVLRPHSLPGGCLEMLFYAYRYYIIYDKGYGNPKDVFIWTQGFGNLVETTLYLVILSGYFQNIRKEKMALIIVSAMTAYKTFLYSLYTLEIPIGHEVESWFGEFLIYGMGSFWIICPSLTMWELSKHFMSGENRNQRNMEKSSMVVTDSVKSEDMADDDDDDDDDGEVVEVKVPNRRQYNLRRR